jgi:hypothetical protein
MPSRTGRTRDYDRDVLDRVLQRLFDKRGRLEAHKRGWNSYARVVDAMQEVCQNSDPEIPCPGETQSKKILEEFLGRYPNFDLVEPRRKSRLPAA